MEHTIYVKTTEKNIFHEWSDFEFAPISDLTKKVQLKSNINNIGKDNIPRNNPKMFKIEERHQRYRKRIKRDEFYLIFL